jgi:hypothetical protein
MGDITTADLLTVQKNITDANRADNQVLRQEVSAQIGTVRTEVREVRTEQESQKHEIGELRTIVEERTRGGLRLHLTPKQKSALWTLATSGAIVVIELIRQFTVWLAGKGPVHP